MRGQSGELLLRLRKSAPPLFHTFSQPPFFTTEINHHRGGEAPHPRSTRFGSASRPLRAFGNARAVGGAPAPLTEERTPALPYVFAAPVFYHRDKPPQRWGSPTPQIDTFWERQQTP